MDENKMNNELFSSAEEEPNTTKPAETASEEEVVVQIEEEIQAPVPQAEAEVPKSSPAVPPSYTYKWDYTAQSGHDSALRSDKKKKGLLTYATILSVAFLSAILLLIGTMIFGNTGRTFRPSADASADTSIADLYEFCHPSYVAISTVSADGGEGAGSGIIMTADGYICTNQHVVEDAETIKVILSDERMYTAEYIDGDAINDIAVIKINVHGLTPAQIGSSQDSRVGDRVMAIGTPYGIEYRGTMTSGFISALDRQHVLHNDSGSINKVQKLIQTDTSVNPGNSGGPLFNMNGEVIGVVAMKITGSQYEGMGFAIPIETVIDMINDIIENGKITNSTGGAKEGAALGISGHLVTEGTTYLFAGDSICIVVDDPETGDKIAIHWVNDYYHVEIPLNDKDALAEYGLQDYTLYDAPTTGYRVDKTFAGFNSDEVLKIDDIILSINGQTVTDRSVIYGVLAESFAGDVVDLEIYRDGEILTIPIILGRSAAME